MRQPLTLEEIAEEIEDNDWIYYEEETGIDKELVMDTFKLSEDQFNQLQRILGAPTTNQGA